jgi:EAL domain-containing protein (putative c-di-GMP-specific phosphodiesterase class I)
MNTTENDRLDRLGDEGARLLTGMRPTCQGCADGLAPPFAFSMAFQPIVDLEKQRVKGYEALVRGPAGEAAGSVFRQVGPETLYAFDQSCRLKAIALAAQLRLAERDASLSINFKPGAMYDPEACVRPTLAAARRHGFPQDKIVFELTEDEPIDDFDHLKSIFRVYRSHQFRTAVDDFGAGYAGLSLLAEYQPDIVKLDLGLIRGIDTHAARGIVVGSVAEMCAKLGVEVIAEGVETRAELDALRSLGLRFFQGYLFAGPEFERLPDVQF